MANSTTVGRAAGVYLRDAVPVYVSHLEALSLVSEGPKNDGLADSTRCSAARMMSGERWPLWLLTPNRGGSGCASPPTVQHSGNGAIVQLAILADPTEFRSVAGHGAPPARGRQVDGLRRVLNG